MDTATSRRRLLRGLPRCLGGLALLAGLAPQPAAAAPRADLWPRWQRHDQSSRTRVDHQRWADFLSTYLVAGSDGINRLDYSGALAASGSLQVYLTSLQAVPVSRLARDEQFAFWANLYNAQTVATVLQHYPVASIRDIDISPGLFADGPWGAAQTSVEGVSLSLDDIEHRILRPIWRDPRLHYAVNCASLGCPNLQPEPFHADRLDQQLDRAARQFVKHPRAAAFEPDGLVVSSLYRWYRNDFGGSDAGIIAHLKRHADPALARRLATVTEIADDRYDWALNDLGSTART